MQDGVSKAISTPTMLILVLGSYLVQQQRHFCLLAYEINTVQYVPSVVETMLNQFHNTNTRSSSSCSMEADIILEGFCQSENMHGLRYLWLIGDGDSSVYHSVVTGVPSYGRDITKVECANHAVKYYRNRLEALCIDKPQYRGKHGLSQAMMKCITHGARCVIKMHSNTSDVTPLRHDLRNGPRHYFGLHDKCNSAFCKRKSTESTGKTIIHFKVRLLAAYSLQDHHLLINSLQIFFMTLRQQEIAWFQKLPN